METTSNLQSQILPLSAWLSGQEGTIEAIEGSYRLSLRLREVGAVPGAPIRVLKTGCPLIIQVGTSRFCLRRTDAGCIRGKRAA